MTSSAPHTRYSRLRPSLSAAAWLGLFSISAQAATGNVDVYGVIDIGATYQIVDTPRLLSDMAFQGADMVLAGAHSRPLALRVDPGRNAFWMAGDWGRDDHGDRNGDLGLAELGIGRNFGAAQINVALGRAWSNQKHVSIGDLDQEGTYLLAEVLMPIEGKLWGVLDGYFQRGQADMRRNYLYSGLPSVSVGDTDTRTWALRALLEWVDGARLGDVGLSPYAELGHVRTHIDGYVETGGDSPNAFGSHEDSVTELRLGVHGSKPLSGALSLLGQMEGVHRFDDASSRVSGQVIGQAGYVVLGQAYKQNWLRLGLGVESRFGDGSATLMLNLTTEGEAPDAWLAAGYRRAF